MSTGGVSDGEADTASSAGGGAQAEAQRQSDQRSSREGAMAPPGSRDEEGAGGLRPAWWPRQDRAASRTCPRSRTSS